MADAWFKYHHYDILMEAFDRSSASIKRERFLISEIAVDGEVAFLFPENDFCAISWHYNAKKKFELGFDDHDRFISLHYIPAKALLVIVPAVARTIISVYSGENQEAVSLLFEQSWLLRQFSNARSKQLEKALTDKRKAIYFYLSDFERRTAVSVADFFEKNQGNRILLNAAIFTLLDHLGSQLEAIDSVRKRKESDLSIHQVELVLAESLLSSLPPISELAKVVAVSTSTLKRKFKNTYGISISEWFLTRKMELGKELLKNSRKKISQIAYELGYERSDAFITMFRKFNQITPCEWRRQNKSVL